MYGLALWFMFIGGLALWFMWCNYIFVTSTQILTLPFRHYPSGRRGLGFLSSVLCSAVLLSLFLVLPLLLSDFLTCLRNRRRVLFSCFGSGNFTFLLSSFTTSSYAIDFALCLPCLVVFVSRPSSCWKAIIPS